MRVLKRQAELLSTVPATARHSIPAAATRAALVLLCWMAPWRNEPAGQPREAAVKPNTNLHVLGMQRTLQCTLHNGLKLCAGRILCAMQHACSCGSQGRAAAYYASTPGPAWVKCSACLAVRTGAAAAEPPGTSASEESNSPAKNSEKQAGHSKHSQVSGKACGAGKHSVLC